MAIAVVGLLGVLCAIEPAKSKPMVCGHARLHPFTQEVFRSRFLCLIFFFEREITVDLSLSLCVWLVLVLPWF